MSNRVLIWEKQCEILEFYSNGEHLECYIPPLDDVTVSSPLPITVKVNGQYAVIDIGANLAFTYSWDRTSLVYHITPFQAPPGYPIAFHGK